MSEIRPVPFNDQELTWVAARTAGEKRSCLTRSHRFELRHDRFSSIPQSDDRRKSHADDRRKAHAANALTGDDEIGSWLHSAQPFE
jgi:hypothetical protein